MESLNNLENNHSRPNENRNGDIEVSTNKECTILNYFGLVNTYDPFSDINALQHIENIDFIIPTKSSFEGKSYIDVNTGLLCTSMSFLEYCHFQIINRENGFLIKELNNVIGEIGNKTFIPKADEIFWFNRDGLKSTFYISDEYKGQILRIVSGEFATTAITSAALNEMFARTIGVPAYIKRIQQRLDEQDARITQKFKELDAEIERQNARIEQYKNELNMQIEMIRNGVKNIQVYSRSYVAVKQHVSEKCNVVVPL